MQKLRGYSGHEMELPYDIRIRPWYNQDFVSAFYMVPGIMGTVLTMTLVMFTSMAIVRERERGTLEQLIVTPMKTWELLIGKIIPYIFVGYVQVTVALLVGIFMFDLPVRAAVWPFCIRLHHFLSLPRLPWAYLSRFWPKHRCRLCKCPSLS